VHYRGGQMKLLIMFLISLISVPIFSKENPLIIDTHVHYISNEITQIFPSIPPTSLEEIIQKMDEKNVSKSFVLSFAYMLKYTDQEKRLEYTQRENNLLAEGIKKYPGRLIGFCSFSFEEEWVLDEIERCHEIGLKGIKLHLENNGIDLADARHAEKYALIYEKAAKLRMVLLVHPYINNYASLIGFLGISIFGSNPMGPTTPVIIAHALGAQYRMLFDLTLFSPPELIKNLYIDISATFDEFQSAPISLRQELVWYLKNPYSNSDNILFASDFSGWDVNPNMLDAYDASVLGEYGFSPEEKEKIFGTNAMKLINFMD